MEEETTALKRINLCANEEDEQTEEETLTKNLVTEDLSLYQQVLHFLKQRNCILCKVNEKQVLTLPCSHVLMCRGCHEYGNVCPCCQERIQERIYTYLC